MSSKDAADARSSSNVARLVGSDEQLGDLSCDTSRTASHAQVFPTDFSTTRASSIPEYHAMPAHPPSPPRLPTPLVDELQITTLYTPITAQSITPVHDDVVDLAPSRSALIGAGTIPQLLEPDSAFFSNKNSIQAPTDGLAFSTCIDIPPTVPAHLLDSEQPLPPD